MSVARFLDGGGSSAITPKPRPPLPPFDPDTFESPNSDTPPSLHPVYTTLPAQPPPAPNVRWWRGDAWGVTVPGLPAVPGGASGPAQERVLTYFLDRYGRDWEERILIAHAERGYTHFSICPQDTFAAGRSLADYVAMAKRVKAAGFFVHHLIRSKYQYNFAQTYDPAEMRPILDALLNADAMDVETPAWEMNWASPETCRAVIDHDAAVIGDRAVIMLHFFPHYISWQRNNETPTDFWLANRGKVDGVLYQCDPAWTAGMMAARMTDALQRLAPGGLWGLPDSGRGHPYDVVGWETIASQQYWNDHTGNGRLADEPVGAVMGYELCCAPGPIRVAGYGNGGALPSGEPL